MSRLEGKVAIITGGYRGLGKTLCLAMAREGVNVVAVDILEARQTVEEIRAKGASAIAIKADISSEEDVHRMAEETVKHFGRIDILVNNAGIGFTVRKSFFDISAQEWDRVMAVNIKGTWHCIKAVFPQMKKQGKGKIIDITSATFFMGTHGFAHYVASKGAVIGLTRAIAREVGDYGIFVNAVAAGHLANEAGLALMGGDVSKFDVKPLCIKRMGTPEDVVGAVLFLASDESDFITGQTIVVDGGRVTH